MLVAHRHLLQNTRSKPSGFATNVDVFRLDQCAKERWREKEKARETERQRERQRGRERWREMEKETEREGTVERDGERERWRKRKGEKLTVPLPPHTHTLLLLSPLLLFFLPSPRTARARASGQT